MLLTVNAAGDWSAGGRWKHYHPERLVSSEAGVGQSTFSTRLFPWLGRLFIACCFACRGPCCKADPSIGGGGELVCEQLAMVCHALWVLRVSERGGAVKIPHYLILAGGEENWRAVLGIKGRRECGPFAMSHVGRDVSKRDTLPPASGAAYRKLHGAQKSCR
jgi:hypothetical protein